MHFRGYFDSDYIGHWDLPTDRAIVVTITKVERGKVTGKGGRSSSKCIVHMKGKSKPLAANITNARAIAGMYGTDTREWVGKQIALYRTTTEMGGETVECIRVKPTITQRPTGSTTPTPPPASGPAADENDAAEPEGDADEHRESA